MSECFTSGPKPGHYVRPVVNREGNSIMKEQDMNRHIVKLIDKYTREAMAITGLDYQPAQQLMKLIRQDDSPLSVEAAMRQVGLDTDNAKMVAEFMNYLEFADTDERS